MTALYELAHAYRTDLEKLADLDLDEATLSDTLESLGGELEVKAQNVVFFARNLETAAAAIKDAEAKMAARRKAIENRAAGLLRYVKESMDHAGITKIECPYFAIKIQNNPPAVDVFEPGLLPSEFMTQPAPPPPAPNKTLIKEAIKAGKDIPGARLTTSQRLDVK